MNFSCIKRLEDRLRIELQLPNLQIKVKKRKKRQNGSEDFYIDVYELSRQILKCQNDIASKSTVWVDGLGEARASTSSVEGE